MSVRRLISPVAVVVLFSGCFFLGWGGDARDASETWHQPGLYQRLSGSAPSGFEIEAVRTEIEIPFSNAALDVAWENPALIGVMWGQPGPRAFELGLGVPDNDGDGDGDLVDWEFIIQCPNCPLRVAEFREFAANVTAADAATLDAWTAQYARQELREEYGGAPGIVSVHGPFKVDAFYEAQNLTQRFPESNWGDSIFGDSPGFFQMENEAWSFMFQAPIRVLVKEEGASTYRLECDPQDNVAFRHHGRGNLQDQELSQRLNDTLRALGFEPPRTALRFMHIHGD